MNGWIRFGQIVAALLAAAAPARADCIWESWRIELDRNHVVQERHRISGSQRSCVMSFVPRGATSISGLRLLRAPTHGKVGPDGAYSQISFRYTAKPNFAGVDTFAIELCGEKLGHRGCARVEFTVTVE
jgi:hypothetical protein